MIQLTKQFVKKYWGVTLIELLTVVAIIGILTAVGAPTVAHFLPGIQLNGSARVLSANLREAQERTITEQKPHLIRFSTTSPFYYELIRIDDGDEELIKKINLASSITISLQPSITNNQIVFSTDGGPSSNGQITLTINGASKIVSVSPAGFIKIEN